MSGFFRDTSEEEEGKKKKVSEIAERCNDRRGAKSGRGGGLAVLCSPNRPSPLPTSCHPCYPSRRGRGRAPPGRRGGRPRHSHPETTTTTDDAAPRKSSRRADDARPRRGTAASATRRRRRRGGRSRFRLFRRRMSTRPMPSSRRRRRRLRRGGGGSFARVGRRRSSPFSRFGRSGIGREEDICCCCCCWRQVEVAGWGRLDFLARTFYLSM